MYFLYKKKKKTSYYLVGKHGKARGEMEIPSQSKKNFKCSTLGFPIKFKHMATMNYEFNCPWKIEHCFVLYWSMQSCTLK